MRLQFFFLTLGFLRAMATPIEMKTTESILETTTQEKQPTKNPEENLIELETDGPNDLIPEEQNIPEDSIELDISESINSNIKDLLDVASKIEPNKPMNPKVIELDINGPDKPNIILLNDATKIGPGYGSYKPMNSKVIEMDINGPDSSNIVLLNDATKIGPSYGSYKPMNPKVIEMDINGPDNSNIVLLNDVTKIGPKYESNQPMSPEDIIELDINESTNSNIEDMLNVATKIGPSYESNKSMNPELIEFDINEPANLKNVLLNDATKIRPINPENKIELDINQPGNSNIDLLNDEKYEPSYVSNKDIRPTDYSPIVFGNMAGEIMDASASVFPIFRKRKQRPRRRFAIRRFFRNPYVRRRWMVSPYQYYQRGSLPAFYNAY